MNYQFIHLEFISALSVTKLQEIIRWDNYLVGNACGDNGRAGIPKLSEKSPPVQGVSDRFVYNWKLPAYSGVFYLQLCLGAFLLTVGAFLLTVSAFLLTIGAFLLTVGKCGLRSTSTDCKQRSSTVSKKAPTVSKKSSPQEETPKQSSPPQMALRKSSPGAGS